MKSDIYFFSGTGNSYLLAKLFSQQLAESHIFNIVKYDAEEDGDLNKNFILVFPTYGFSVPDTVLGFLSKVNLDQYSYFFIVTTKGGSPEFCRKDLSKIFQKKKKSIDAFFSIKMPNNSVFIHDFNTPEDILVKINSAKEFVKSSIPLINNRERPIPEEQKMRITQRVIFRLINTVAHHTNYMCFDNGFSVSETCNSCGTCQKVCPTHKVSLIDGLPSWKNKEPCYACTACINYCPRGSIKNKILKPSKINETNQYRNPDISLNEMVKNNL